MVNFSFKRQKSLLVLDSKTFSRIKMKFPHTLPKCVFIDLETSSPSHADENGLAKSTFAR